jgi:DNA-binding response OmpR family regulator
VPPRILIVDDDSNICEILRLYLVHEGLELTFAHNGSEALDKFREKAPDLVILDLMLPVINGWEVCKMIRNQSHVPILMLTAKDTTEDKVSGLGMGADDYVVKPFDPQEVVARVKALLRRSVETGPAGGQKHETIGLGNLQIDLSQYIVSCNGEKIDLKPKEIQLLSFLLRNPNMVFTRDQLLEHVWGYDFMGETRTVDVHVKRLREKLEDKDSGCRITTVWGVGYKLETA